MAPFSFTPTSFDITLIFNALYIELNGFFLLFLEDYEPNHDFKFLSNIFKLAFQHMPHLSTSGPSGIFLNTFKIVLS
jgi:hypothetical protein